MWGRVSTEEQVYPKGRVRAEDQAHKGRANPEQETGSLDHQIIRDRRYAEAKGWEVVAEYRLEGVSGKDLMGHPETLRMLADLRSGHIEGLIFTKLARLARSTKALLELADLFRELEADLIALDESIDTTTPAGRLFYTLIAAMAQWEREEIAARVAASVPVRASLGKSTGGHGVFGYHWVDGRLVPHPDEAPIRALIYELYYEHRRLKTVAKELNRRGYETSLKCAFSDSTVRFLIEDPTPKGQHRGNYCLTPGRNKGKSGRKPESEWVFTPVEPIVDASLWQACNDILEERNDLFRKRGKHLVNLFGGLVHCQRCDRTMYIDTPRKKYRCPGCRARVSVTLLEKIFLAQFNAFFCSPEALAGHAAAEGSLMEQREALLRTRRQEAAQIDIDKEKVLRVFLAEKLSEDDFGEYHQRFALQRRQLDQEIATLEGELDYLRIQNLSHQQTAAEAAALLAGWDEFDERGRANLVQGIVDKLIVHPDGVTLHLLYAPALFQFSVETEEFKNANNRHLFTDDIAL
ncbi:MAG: recombinase family protein [Candidatus Sericytochromatia bacterium]